MHPCQSFVDRVQRESENVASLVRFAHQNSLLSQDQFMQLKIRIQTELENLYRQNTPLEIFWSYIDEVGLDRDAFKSKTD